MNLAKFGVTNCFNFILVLIIYPQQILTTRLDYFWKEVPYILFSKSKFEPVFSNSNLTNSNDRDLGKFCFTKISK